MYKLEGQEMNVKEYAGKKISKIMEITVDFVLLLSNIYHWFFLDLPLVMSDCDPVWPSVACLRFSGIYSLWLTPSVVNLVTLHSAVRLKYHKAWQNPSWCWDYFFPSGCCHLEENGLPEQNGCCHLGGDSAPGPQRLLSQFSPPSFSP